MRILIELEKLGFIFRVQVVAWYQVHYYKLVVSSVLALTFGSDSLETLIFNEKFNELDTQRLEPSKYIRITCRLLNVVLLLNQLQFLTHIVNKSVHLLL